MNVYVHRRLGLAEMLAGCIGNRRDPALIAHTLVEMMRLRMFATACGYEDGDDCDRLRSDPVFKLAVGQAPESGRDHNFVAHICYAPNSSRRYLSPTWRPV